MDLTLSDNLNAFADAIARALGHLRTVSDTITTSDAVSLRYNYHLDLLADSISLTDLVNATVSSEEPTIALDDNFNLTDSSSLELGYFLDTSDSANLTDLITSHHIPYEAILFYERTSHTPLTILLFFPLKLLKVLLHQHIQGLLLLVIRELCGSP